MKVLMNFIHESIFVSSLRAFCKVIFVIFGLAIGFFCISLAAGFISTPYVDPFKPQLLICPDENGNSMINPQAPIILKISIEGMIGSKDLNTKTVTQALNKAKTVLKQDKIKGIFLMMNSPGGTVIDSAGIYQAIVDFKTRNKIPVYTFVDGLCASGGMYISCSSDYIGSTSESIIGSVGVRMGPLYNFKGLMDKLGLDAATITQGKDKDSFNPTRTWTATEGEDIKAILADTYTSFVDIVTKARTKMNKDDLINSYGAQIFSAKTAMNYGYIDESNTSYSKVMKSLRTASGIDDKTSYQVLEIVAMRSPLEEFFDAKIKLLSKSVKEQILDFETRNPICDKLFYLMDL